VFAQVLLLATLGCQQDTTQPSQDVSLLAGGAGLAPTAGAFVHVGNQLNETVSATAPVHFHPRAGEVTTTHSVSGMGNVHMKFLSVEQACLVFTFSGDLLDPGDDVEITVDGSAAGGFARDPGSEPQATRTFCWSQIFHPAIVADFLDGKAKLKFTALSGSVALTSVTLTISGSAR
jgi:hypothetical protein